MIIYLVSLIVILAALAFIIYYFKLVKQKNKMIALLSEQNKSILKTQIDLREAKDKAEESDKLKSAFLANMSHEIRTPLNAIMGFASLMQDTVVDEEDRIQFVSIIYNNSVKLLSLMDEIFDIAKIESGMMQIQHAPCHVNEIIMGLVTFFNLEKGISGKENIQIRMHKTNKDANFTILSDAKRLRQTLFNLIENALKYTNEGNIEIGYELKNNGLVEFYVRDTGIGFQQEKLDTLFQRFRQGDDSTTRQYGGIGLGLTLSQKFAELMGGEMRAESQPGIGSVFYLSLPSGHETNV